MTSMDKNNIPAQNFELNFGDQMIAAYDKSGSMQKNDCPGGLTRFAYVQKIMKEFIKEAAKFDPDGVSFYFFNDKVIEHPDVKTTQEIDQIISKLSPGGSTRTDLAIKAAYKEHKAKGNEQTFLMLFTDGVPDDKALVEKVIIDITKDVKNEKEFRIAILTVGNRDSALEKWLSDLDDNLGPKGAKYDIVAIHALEEVNFTQAIEDAISGHARSAAELQD